MASVNEEDIRKFVEWCSKNITGKERSQSQIFLDRLFQAFGLGGVLDAGAGCEWIIRVNEQTKFADLLWPKKVLIEMKKRGTDLSSSIQQAKMYWDNAYQNRPEYVVLCNFDEFWIFDWNMQYAPVDKVPLKELPYRWKSMVFLVSDTEKPLFGDNRAELTRVAANRIIRVYQSMISRGENAYDARRFTLQCLVCMFAEDTGMFPDSTLFTSLIQECLDGRSSYDLFSALFRQMSSPTPARGGRFKGVDYFNGGLFSDVRPIELNHQELEMLSEAAKSDWSKVEPSIFGSLFEGSLNDKERHVMGAHYTTIAEIMHVVEPTILRPWRERIDRATTKSELERIHDEMSRFKVLDPACGSGNFLYEAYMGMKRLEMHLVKRLITEFKSVDKHKLVSKIKCNQFYGIELNTLGVELAKITLSMAKKLTADEFNRLTGTGRLVEFDAALPFEDLDANFQVEDALFTEWPEVDAIIGNPPYQSKNKMLEEFGTRYMNNLRKAYPDVSGRADYCVYWFRKAQDNLKPGGRAGLVGTNTISQTYSRTSGLDYIVDHGGTITDAISTMPWSGEAAVYVAIVNWINGPYNGTKYLRANPEGKGWQEFKLDYINSSLSPKLDVSDAKPLLVNKSSNACSQGQTHKGKGFLVPKQKAESMISENPRLSEVMFPYLNADEMLSSTSSLPTRFVIDFGKLNIIEASQYEEAFEIVKNEVLPESIKAAEKEIKRNAELLAEDPNAHVNRDHQSSSDRWWLLFRPRPELMKCISKINRYIVCGRVTKRPIFEFISTSIHPNDALIAFPLDDDYSFGILQSSMHWDWFTARCSTLKGDPRYTSTTVFDCFPWPQWGFEDSENHVREYCKLVENIAKAGRKFRVARRKMMTENDLSLREIYRLMELPGENPLKKLQIELDKAVRTAYLIGVEDTKAGNLELAYNLNQECARREKEKKLVFGPGIPSFVKDRTDLVSDDCVRMFDESAE